MQIYRISAERFLTLLQHGLFYYAMYLVLCLLAWRLKWLTLGGSIVALAMAVIFHLEGPDSFLVPMWLLVGGTLVSKLNKSTDSEKGRTAMQVLANGGIGTICVLVAHIYSYSLVLISPTFWAAYLIAFSVSICDTFSSEIGKYFSGNTYDVLAFRKVPPGLSGGVSIAGTLGGLFALIPVFIIEWVAFDMQLEGSLILALFAFAGMLVDSILGSLLQAKYKDGHGNISESPLDGYALYKGYRWCNNDVVNFLSVLLITALGIFLL